MGDGYATVRSATELGARGDARALTPAETTWIAAVPWALLTVAAIVLLGPPVGHAFLAPSPEPIYPGVPVLPEPVEHGRYAVALLSPLLFALLLPVAMRRPVRASDTTARSLVTLSQTAAFCTVALFTLAQYGVVSGSVRLPWSGPVHYFKPATLLAAGACTVLLLAIVRSRRSVALVTGWVRETHPRRIASTTLAAVFAAAWLLRSVNLDSTIANGSLLNLIPWQMSEAFAVLDGRTPLVDFHAMYSQLWSGLVGGVLAVAGASVGVWTVTMVTLSGAALMAVFAVFRRVAGRSALALLLFAPFVAMSFWVVGSPSAGTSIASVFSIWPLRYAGPYLLAWLTARHVDRAAPRMAWIVFLAAGLVLVNNLEVGLGACVGTIVALALTPAARTQGGLLRLAREAAAGLAAAVALVSVLTLLRAGRLPDFGLMLEFPQLFGRDGWGLEPMPSIGLHLVMYVTFASAIAVGTVRALRDADGAVLTSMLGWAGTFGLFAGSYYVGRSEPGNLMPLLSTWSFALALLLVVVVQSLLAQPRLPTPLELAVIFGFALGIGSLPNMPTPWSQVERLQRHTAAIYEQPEATRFVAARTRPGERVAIFAPLGFRIAHDLQLDDVSPYSSLEAMRKPSQVRVAVDAVLRAHVHKVFLKGDGIGEESGNLPWVEQAFEAAGFRIASQELRLTAFVD